MAAEVQTLAHTDARADFAYINEGNAAAVFAYNGPPHPRFTRTVLRLRKISANAHSQVDEQSLATDVDDTDDPMLAFQRVAIDPLVPPEYRARIETVVLDPDWLATFAEAHAHNLRAGASFDTRRTRATLAENLIGFPWAVEIKPKWGFLPTSIDASSVKSRTCRTCMHDHYRRVKKIKDTHTQPVGEEQGVEPYCPLDLFSGDETRVRRALGALWSRWEHGEGKENKLRMFIPWRMLVPADTVATAEWKQHCLGLPHDADIETCREAFIARLLPALCTTPVLPLLASLQRRLDVLGTPVGLQNKYPDAEPTLSEWATFIERLQRDEVHEEDAPLAYMLSATFKDCSLIIGLPDGEEPIAKLVDLDVKSVSKFAYWLKLDQDIVDSYNQLDESERKICVDALRG